MPSTRNRVPTGTDRGRDGDAPRRRRRLARRAASGVDRDVVDDGDLPGGVCQHLVHAGAASAPDGDAGNLRRRRRAPADDRPPVDHRPGVHARSHRSRRRDHGRRGDGHGDGAGRLRVGSAARVVELRRRRDGDVPGDAGRDILHRCDPVSADAHAGRVRPWRGDRADPRAGGDGRHHVQRRCGRSLHPGPGRHGDRDTRPQGVAWPATLPDGWTVASPTTATFVLRFDPVVCRIGTPVAPVIAQATSTNGAVTTPTVTLDESRWIVYTVDPQGPYDGTATTTVTVTAVVRDGYAWGSMPPAWTQLDSSRASYSLTLTAASCTEVVPVTPKVTQALCREGVVTAPTLTTPTTDGITYAVEPSGSWLPGSTATVTATLGATEVGWPDKLPAGWVETSPTTASYTVVFDPMSCQVVVPVEPTVTHATCAGGVVQAPTIDLPPVPGIVFHVEPFDLGDGAEDVSVTVTADAAVARNAGTVCAILVADCVPVLLTDHAGTTVAAAHAGWRGLAGGVVENAVRAMRCPPGDLMAFLGPGIGPRAFEVGSDVRDAFLAGDPDAGSAFVAHAPGKWLADLFALARRRLARAGVSSVFGGGLCTHSRSSQVLFAPPQSRDREDGGTYLAHPLIA